MDILPAELLDLIVSHCDHSSLKKLRIVNRQYHDASTAPTFEHFYMGLFEHSLDNLVSLAKSPLAKHVQSFTFYSDTLPDWDRLRWEQSIDYRSDIDFWSIIQAEHVAMYSVNVGNPAFRETSFARYQKLPRHCFTTQQLDQGWREFQRLQREQQKWREDVHGLIFKEYFAMLPSITKAKVVPSMPFSGRISKWPVWKRLRTHMLVSPNDWMYTSDEWSYGALNKIRASLSGQASLRLLEAIGFRASFAGTKHITKVQVHTTHDGSWQRLMGWRTGQTRSPDRAVLECRSRYNTIVEGFRHLEELILRIPHAAESDEIGGERAGVEVFELLHAATKLRSLSLVYNDDVTGLSFSPVPSESSLALLFKSPVHWQLLEHLSLSVDTTHELLLSFLRLLAPTLHSLELRDMLVQDAAVLIQTLPKILSLRHVYVEGIWHQNPSPNPLGPNPYSCVFAQGTDVEEPYEQAVKAYLLGQSYELPELRTSESE